MATGAVLGAAMAGPAAAQQAAAPPSLSDARVFELGLSARVYYDSNIARGSDLTAATRGIAPEDIIYQPAITANILQPLGTQMVYLAGSAGYDFHQRNTKLDRGNVNLQGGYTARVGFCQPSLTSSFSGRQSDLEDADAVTTSNLLQAVTVGASLQCGRPIGPGFQGGVSRTHVTNSADTRQESDYDSETANLAVVYVHPTLGQASVVWNYASSEFPNRIIPGRPVGDGFFTNTFGISYQRQFGQKLAFSGSFGRTMAKREFAGPGEPLKFTTTSYTGAVDYRLGQRLALNATAARSVKPSNRPGKVYDISTVVEGSASYTLGSRYTVDLGQRYAENNSNADTAPGTRPVVTKSRNYVTYGSVHFAQSDRINWELNAEYDKRKTNLPQFNYTSTRVGLTTSVKF